MVCHHCDYKCAMFISFQIFVGLRTIEFGTFASAERNAGQNLVSKSSDQVEKTESGHGCEQSGDRRAQRTAVGWSFRRILRSRLCFRFERFEPGSPERTDRSRTAECGRFRCSAVRQRVHTVLGSILDKCFGRQWSAVARLHAAFRVRHSDFGVEQQFAIARQRIRQLERHMCLVVRTVRSVVSTLFGVHCEFGQQFGRNRFFDQRLCRVGSFVGRTDVIARNVFRLDLLLDLCLPRSIQR